MSGQHAGSGPGRAASATVARYRGTPWISSHAWPARRARTSKCGVLETGGGPHRRDGRNDRQRGNDGCLGRLQPALQPQGHGKATVSGLISAQFHRVPWCHGAASPDRFDRLNPPERRASPEFVVRRADHEAVTGAEVGADHPPRLPRAQPCCTACPCSPTAPPPAGGARRRRRIGRRRRDGRRR